MIIENKSKIRFEEWSWFAFAGFLSLVSVLVFSSRDIILFRDYAIVFEGGRRLALGESLYIDFGVPVGPFLFEMVSYWFKLTDISWNSLQTLQIILNAIYITCIGIIFSKLNTPKSLIFLGMTVSCFLCTFFWPYPWYNSTAVIFCFIAICCAMTSPVYSLITGIMLCMAVFTKQDIGIIFTAVIIIGLFSQYYLKEKSLFEISLRLSFILSSFAIFGLSISYIYSNEIYLWLNPNNYDFSTRSEYLLNALKSIHFWLGISFAALGIYNSKNTLIIAGAIISVSGITVHTSGMPLSHFYYMPFIVLVFWFCFSQQSKTITLYLFLSCIFLSFNPLVRFLYLIENYFSGKFEVSAINHRKINYNLNIGNLGHCTPEFEGVFGPLNCEFINAPFDEFSKISGTMINYTELSPPQIWNYKIYPGLPLWNHKNVSVPKNIENKLKDLIMNKKVDFVLLQPIFAAGYTSLYKDMFEKLSAKNSGYKRLSDIVNTPSSVFCENKKLCSIYRFVLTND